MCTIGKVQGKAALAVAASHRKLGLRAVCVYQHQPVTGYDIGIHHHVQGDIDLGNAVTADQGHGHNTLTICQRTVEDRQTREVGVGGSNCLQSGRIFLRTGGNIYPMAGQNACLIQVEVYIGIGNQSRNHFLFLKDKATICTMAALSQACFGAGCCNSRVNHFGVVGGGDNFLGDQYFITVTAVATFSQARFGAGGSYGNIFNYVCMIVGIDRKALCRNDIVTAFCTAVLLLFPPLHK